jgi:1-acyl-sn-glycerol-3-phosphate acyltransferase
VNLLLPVANVVQRVLIDIPCRVDDAELAKVAMKGPLILAANHINALEVPTMLSHLWPRKATGLAKAEAWRNPLTRLLYWIYRAVPVRRGEVDINAVKLCLERLAEGYVLAVAPEGTRSHDGQLQEARPGIALLAVKSGAPVQPIAYFGHEAIWKNLRQFKRTPYIMRVGNPFKIDLHGERINKENSQVITHEIMYQIAALMPPAYRGFYADLSQATERYLQFEPGAGSSLPRAVEMDAYSLP